jgi:hypothetical protein
MNSISKFYSKLGFNVDFICNEMILKSDNFKITLSYIDFSQIGVGISIEHKLSLNNMNSCYESAFTINNSGRSLNYADINGEWLHNEIKSRPYLDKDLCYSSICRNNKILLLGI